jgi:hypothetical protein
MRTPSHGKGKLRVGGTNKGGPGRPPSEIRAALRASFDQRIPVLESIADALKGSPADRTRAIEMMARFGLGTENTIQLAGYPGAQLALEIIKEQIRAKLGSSGADDLIRSIELALRAHENDFDS